MLLGYPLSARDPGEFNGVDIYTKIWIPQVHAVGGECTEETLIGRREKP